jgi:hypothetical protein
VLLQVERGERRGHGVAASVSAERRAAGVAMPKGLLFFLSISMIGALLEQQHPETTARYTHLVHDPVQEVAEQIGEALLRELEG